MEILRLASSIQIMVREEVKLAPIYLALKLVDIYTNIPGTEAECGPTGQICTHTDRLSSPNPLRTYKSQIEKKTFELNATGEKLTILVVVVMVVVLMVVVVVGVMVVVLMVVVVMMVVVVVV